MTIQKYFPTMREHIGVVLMNARHQVYTNTPAFFWGTEKWWSFMNSGTIGKR